MAEAQAVGPVFYPPTPRWLVQALLAEHPIPTDNVIDVGAGDGAITEVLVESGKKVVPIEPRRECRRPLEWYVGLGGAIIADAESGLPVATAGTADWSIICSPSFIGADMLQTMAPCFRHGFRWGAFLLPVTDLPIPRVLLSVGPLRAADAIYWPDSTAWFHGFGEAPVAWCVWDEAMHAEGRQVHKVIGEPPARG